MNRSSVASLIFSVLVMLCCGPMASADQITDINLSVPTPGSSLLITGGTWTGIYAGKVFEGSIPGTSTNDPGFFASAGTFAAGSRIRIDFTRELLFWNGSSLATPAAGLTITTGPRSATITGTNFGGAPGIFISAVPTNGSYHVHGTWSLPSGAADGIYGAVATLGPDGATTGFTTSAPFLVAFEKGASPNYKAGLDAMVNAALVPEPSAIMLTVAGLVGAAIQLRRKTRFRNRVA